MKPTTDKQVLAVRADPSRDVMVNLAPGMYLRVKPSGARAYVQRLQHGGKDRWRVAGHPPKMTLAEALALAHTRKAGGAAAPDSALTCAEAVRTFFRTYIEREWKQTKNAKVYADWLESELASLPLRLLTRERIVHVVQDYSGRKTAKAGRTGGRVAQNRLLAFAKNWLGWCVECGYLATNPATGLTPRVAGGTEKTRDRVLSPDEIRAMWALDCPHAPLLRALLLTGCRIRELQLARIRDLQPDEESTAPDAQPVSLLIPAERSKNKKPHRVPLTTAVLVQMDLAGKPADPLFRGSSGSAFAVQSWIKRWHEREGTEPWTPHDLRRTFATLLGSLGVPVETISRCLNHTLQGPTAIYARHDAYNERRDALEKLAQWVKKNVAAPVEFGPAAESTEDAQIRRLLGM
jgi:integrase